MYSWEIDNYLRNKNYVIDKYEYINISDIKNNPQINCIKYDVFLNSFYIGTSDGYNWIFWIKE